ncbi:adenylate kinase [Candidatus Phytoplasma prunorum]|uniref:adenylate kinase n=1 Tax=Candidatus Phytoplasma prunorum TaxID=47565 RepID=UPI002FF07094
MKIILLGAPGTGKGTQANLLSQMFKLYNISTGDMFRKNFSQNTELGKLAKTYILKGLLVPDEITNKMVIDFLSEEKFKKGFLLDGFPRNLVQAKMLKNFFQTKKINLTAVIYLNTSKECLQKRITGRRICSKCGKIYHIETKIPRNLWFCDDDQNPLVQRKDDQKETFLKRLEVYKKETLPLVKYFKNQTKTHFLEIKVDNLKTSIAEVTNLILFKMKKVKIIF